jgi:hypothetical protein
MNGKPCKSTIQSTKQNETKNDEPPRQPCIHSTICPLVLGVAEGDSPAAFPRHRGTRSQVRQLERFPSKSPFHIFLAMSQESPRVTQHILMGVKIVDVSFLPPGGWTDRRTTLRAPREYSSSQGRTLPMLHRAYAHLATPSMVIPIAESIR